MTHDPKPRALMCASRRAALGIAGGGALAGALAACGGGGEDGGAGAPPKESGSSAPGGDNGGGGTIAQVDDIPVGGGTVFKDQKVVITQPTEGTIVGFSAECTHQGCVVGEVADGQIVCPCHDSRFEIADGSVAGGPAEKPLPKVEVTVDGGQISLA